MRMVFATNIAAGATTVEAGDLASARYRAFIPAEALRQGGVQAEVISIQEFFQPDFDCAIDLLVLHQPKYGIVLHTNEIGLMFDRLEAIRARGGVIALDVSDFKFTAESHTALARGIGEEAAKAYRAILDAIFARSTVVTTPTEGLAELMRIALGGKLPVFVIDDVVEVERKPARFAPGDELKLMWFGRVSSHSAALTRFVHYDLPRIEAVRPTQMTMVC